MTFLAVRISSRPPDHTHLYGHGKVENLSALFESALLVVTCAWIVWEAVRRLFYHRVEVEVTFWSFAVMLTSIAIDFSRSRVLARAAKKFNSQALEADALHFRTDIWSSSVVILGLIAVKAGERFPVLAFLREGDAVAALGVSAVVVWVCVQLGRRTIDALVDKAPAGLEQRIAAAVGAVPGVRDCHQVRVRYSGPVLFVDLHVLVDGGQTLTEAHDLTEDIEEAIHHFAPDADITVHPEPVQTGKPKACPTLIYWRPVMKSDWTRRELLSGIAGAALAGCHRAGTEKAAETEPTGPADVTLRIGRVSLDIAEGKTIRTTGYNGTVPGPLIRLRESQPVIVDLFNDTDVAELVHWHGQVVPARVDGAEEEKSLAVPAHGHLRYRLTPQPSGARFVHSHVMPMSDVTRGTYSGQFAFVYIEPKNNPGQYDQELFLATHEWEPELGSEEEEEEDEPGLPPPHPPAGKKDETPNGWEIGYKSFTINGRCLGYGEPVHVMQGQRVLFHFMNGSATENIKLALPGHQFQVVGLDGNPVPKPQMVDVLELGTAERVDAVVEMKNPGVWVLGTPKDDDRMNGMGIVVEYANKTGKPRWIAPPKKAWDYTLFGDNRPTPIPEETIPLVFGKINGGKGQFNHWTINGKEFDAKAEPRRLMKGKRCRLVFDNQTDDAHPVHLHRNSFELTSVYDKPTSGVLKDVVLVKGYRKIEADVTPDQDGLTLFHCHQQLHMDYGFKLLFNVV